MKIVFFRTPKPRQFVHKNIYYDPLKEERAEREERVNKELGVTDETKSFTTSIRRGSFRRSRFDADDMPSRDELANSRRMKSVRSIIIIIASLLFAAYIIATSGDFLAL
jgi:hypothetical protein